MTPQECKSYVLKMMDYSCDDSLERAELSFRGLDDEAMQKPHGASGRTRKEILDGYRIERQRFNQALAWLKSVDA